MILRTGEKKRRGREKEMMFVEADKVVEPVELKEDRRPHFSFRRARVSGEAGAHVRLLFVC